ncbi:hypothetical protein FAZ21_06425 [Chitiniphilus eburneus]|uniref:Uncharacterized protein n=1 Tax=Chitiniphilus eburneus TaxID=2571148 RepID=A0A4U0Q3B3_9NEIS|nr:hypothetical protein FAZ21_06425 [Chitiniphilus eburneus]
MAARVRRAKTQCPVRPTGTIRRGDTTHRTQRGSLAATRAGEVGIKQDGPLPAFPIVTRPALSGTGSGYACH